MAASQENISMALFCDFENVALGVRDVKKLENFDIKPVLERLLLKGSIVVKKAYCDWDRYKAFKSIMHEANFELIEIPHVRQSGKNSADIRLVVDALDLCYTKSHVNTFVIISGDSDFSPLVSKLRENAKQVIGVGVKQSTSDLLIANCDEFIFYDDLVRDNRRAAARSEAQQTQAAPKRSSDEEKRRKEEMEARKSKAVDLVVETFDALVTERGDTGKIWASMLKNAIKRRKPDFNETYYGFRTFGALLEEAQKRGLLEIGRDEKSGFYAYRSSGALAANETVTEAAHAHVPEAAPVVEEKQQSKDRQKEQAQAKAQAKTGTTEESAAKQESRRKGRSSRKARDKEPGVAEPGAETTEATVQPDVPEAPVVLEVAQVSGAKAGEAGAAPAQVVPGEAPTSGTASTAATGSENDVTQATGASDAPAKPGRKTASRSRRPRKTAADSPVSE